MTCETLRQFCVGDLVAFTDFRRYWRLINRLSDKRASKNGAAAG